jgi:Kef-type K+ transport system membrane component KefB
VAAMNFDNLVAVLAVAAAVPLILTAVPQVRVPGPVLEIVAGIVLGPAALDLVKPDQAVRLVSTIGLAFLLFLAGQFAIAGASLGELTPVVLLSLFFSGRTTAIGSKLLLLSLLGVLVVLVVIGTLRIERSMWITRMINRLADTSAQIRIRLSILLVVGLGALATHLGFEAILGAFIAGAILRLVDADAERKHPLFHPKLDAIGYGFLIPVFFVTSGLTFNLSVLFSSAATLLRVPLFLLALLALLVVRGLPAVLYRSALASIRDVAAAGLLQATSLPFIVAATTIGLQLHAISSANAAALVAAGLFSVILFPVIALQLLRSSAEDPSMVPEQAQVR